MNAWRMAILSGAAILLLPCAPIFAGANGYFMGLTLRDSGPEAASPLEAAAKAASAGVGSARDQLHRLAIGISRQFETSPGYQEARQGTLAAFNNYGLSEAGALQAARSTPQAVSARIEVERLENQLDAARQDAKLAGLDHSDKIDSLALELLAKRTAITHRESQVLAADDALNTLRYAWLDANAKLIAMQDDFTQQLHCDPQWRAAKSQLEQARTALASISQ